MFIILAISLSGIFMTLELFRVNKYTSRFLASVPLFLLFSMVAFNRMNRDYSNYLFAFESEIYRKAFEFGFTFLVNVVEKLGGDHRTIVFLVGSLMMFTLLKTLKTSSYINLVVFFYCIFPLIFDLNQIRNFMMYLLVILSFPYISSGKPIKHYLMLFIAFSLHSFALVYTPFYYLCKKSRRKFLSFMIKATVICFIGSPIVISIATRFFPAKMHVYMSNPPKFGVIIVFLNVIVDVFTVWWVDKAIKDRISEEDNQKLEVFYRFVWFTVIILPFSFYFLELSRMERDVLLVKYIYCALAMKYLGFYQRLFVVCLLIVSAAINLIMVTRYGHMGLFDYLDDNVIMYYLDRHLF